MFSTSNTYEVSVLSNAGVNEYSFSPSDNIKLFKFVLVLAGLFIFIVYVFVEPSSAITNILFTFLPTFIVLLSSNLYVVVFISGVAVIFIFVLFF